MAEPGALPGSDPGITVGRSGRCSLTDALDQPGIDMEGLLRALLEDIRLAVPSYLGLTITSIIDDYPVTLTALDSDTDTDTISASVMLPLTALDSAVSGSTIVFYARNAGAFVDFAADVCYTLGIEAAQIVLDDHLTAPVDTFRSAAAGGAARLGGLDKVSQHNQAVGILIVEGFLAEPAAAELHRRAQRDGISGSAAAQQLIESIAQRAHPHIP